MSIYHGKCAHCGEVSSLELIHLPDDETQKVCFMCFDAWADKQTSVQPPRQDPDDERKYGKY